MINFQCIPSLFKIIQLVAMETGQFHIAQTAFFLGTKSVLYLVDPNE